MKLNNENVIDVEVDGIDMKDYPDFCDAYISFARFEKTGIALDEEQLYDLQDQNWEEFNEHVLDYVQDCFDKHYSC